jgi:Skp family chaperone for outer membrane proteins
MKRIITIILTLATAVFAMTTAQAASTTIATVNMQKIFTTAPQVKKINAKLEKKFASRNESLLKEEKKLQAKIKKLEKDETILKKSDLNDLRKKVSKGTANFREKKAKFQQELYNAQNGAMRDFMKTLSKAVESIAKKRNISVVIPSNNLLYSQSNLDITKDVLEKLN